MVYSWLNNIQFILLPGRCVVCRGSSNRPMDLCLPCERDITAPWPSCLQCGLPAPINTACCGHCSKEAPVFHRCIALAPYLHPLDRVITEFKYQRRIANGKVLAKLLANTLAQRYQDDALPDLLLPVPLHWRRQWRRGFNQAHYIASQLAKDLGIPVQDELLRRSRYTPSQQGLVHRQRRRNLHGAFSLTASAAGKHIALVDDVVTTATTANVISRLLLARGAARVDVWCLARTPPPSA